MNFDHRNNLVYSYQHRYHAGNFADLHKHLILLAVLTLLQQKTTPYSVLDLFAGEGIYNLNCNESQKNKEYLWGFEKIKNLKASIQELNKSIKTDIFNSVDDISTTNLIMKFLQIADHYQQQWNDQFKHITIQEKNTIIYPGSPAIIQSMLRKNDHAIFVENHPTTFLQLKQYFKNKANIHLHKRDAIEALPALLPFNTTRGVILLDPNYEIKNTYTTLEILLKEIYKKFPNYIYMLWYPILQENRHKLLINNLTTLTTKFWINEFIPTQNSIDHMYGSGMLIFNQPWLLSETINKPLEILKNLLLLP